MTDILKLPDHQEEAEKHFAAAVNIIDNGSDISAAQVEATLGVGRALLEIAGELRGIRNSLL
jgi:hypothetical protein